MEAYDILQDFTFVWLDDLIQIRPLDSKSISTDSKTSHKGFQDLSTQHISGSANEESSEIQPELIEPSWGGAMTFCSCSELPTPQSPTEEDHLMSSKKWVLAAR